MKTKVTTLPFFALIFLIGLFPAFGQKKVIVIEDKRITIEIEKRPLGEVFRYLMENYDLAIGFEQSILDRNHNDYCFQTNLPFVGRKKMVSTDGSIKLDIEVERIFEAKKHPITVSVVNGSLADVFNQIVPQMENYTWELNNGVVNIFPIRGRDDRFNELLETEIRNFILESDKTVNDITFSMFRLGAFNRWLKKNNLHFNPARTGSSIELEAQCGRKLNAEMSFSNLKFRDLLNKITRIKKGGWILKWESISASGAENIDLDI